MDLFRTGGIAATALLNERSHSIMNSSAKNAKPQKPHPHRRVAASYDRKALLVVLCWGLALGTTVLADSYRLELSLQPAQSKLAGRMTLRYHNLSSEPLTEVRLRLDPNLSASPVLTLRSVHDATGLPMRWSFRPFKFGAKASENRQVSVVLPQPLPPQQQLELRIEFEYVGKLISEELVALQDDPFTSLNAWYPKAMTLRDGSWSIDDDRPSSYSVMLDLPASFTVASTGRAAQEKLATGGRKTVQLEAEAVRGFAIYASKALKEQRRTIKGLELRALLPEPAQDLAQPMLEAAADAVAFYETNYGPYPARHLDLLALGSLSDKPHGSSAACNIAIVWLGGQFKEQYRFLIAHEVAHQYFGSLVGLPRKEIGWAPIGLGMAMDHAYMVRNGLDDKSIRKTILWFYFEAVRRGYDTSLTQPVDKLMMSPPPWSYGWNMSLMHGKAYAVVGLLQDLLGQDKFRAVIRKIIRERAGGLLSGADLLRYCETELGSSLDWFAADWLRGQATLDYAISGARPVGSQWEVSINRLGPAGFPLTVEAVTEKGQKLRQRVNRQAGAPTLRFATSDPLKSVVIDPDEITPDVKRDNNCWPH